jgi:hypothetical protein
MNTAPQELLKEYVQSQHFTEIDKLFLYDIKNFDFTNGPIAVIMAVNPRTFISSA